jgi:ABC-2 type transport system permease protein
MRLLAAEALKLRTTWGFWVYLVLMLGITALAVSATIGSGVGAFDDESWRDLLQTPALGFLFPLLIGSVTFTNEFRHGTIGQTLLLTPRRGVLLALKLVTAALVGLLFAALAFALTLAIALPWLGAKDVEVGLGDPVVRETGLVVALGFVLLAMFGAAVGGALRSQMGAAVGLLVWFLLVEFLVGALLTALDIEGVARYLPVSAAGAIVGGEDDTEMLSQGAGALVLLAWVVALAGVAAVSLRRDVT